MGSDTEGELESWDTVVLQVSGVQWFQVERITRARALRLE
jgi:translation elongation factor EF-1beta